jgi:hypothetical protein
VTATLLGVDGHDWSVAHVAIVSTEATSEPRQLVADFSNQMPGCVSSLELR